MYINIIAPKFLDTVEYVSPLGKGGDGKIGIANMTVGPIIFSAEPMDEFDENHEVIHIYQWAEVAMLVTVLTPLLTLAGLPWWVAPLVALWAWMPGIGAFSVVYGATYAYWWVRLKLSPGEWTGYDAYHLIPFEREAYLFDQDLGYLKWRPWFGWWQISAKEARSDEWTRAKHILGTIVTLRDSA